MDQHVLATSRFLRPSLEHCGVLEPDPFLEHPLLCAQMLRQDVAESKSVFIYFVCFYPFIFISLSCLTACIFVSL